MKCEQCPDPMAPMDCVFTCLNKNVERGCKVRLYTTAPESCDLEGTEVIHWEFGHIKSQSAVVRIVEVSILGFLAQWKCYAAGTYLVTEKPPWSQMVDRGWIKIEDSQY